MQILDSLDGLVGILDQSGIVVDMNSVGIAALGLAKGCVVSKAFWEMPWWSHSLTVKLAVRQQIDASLNGLEDTREHEYVRVDGVHRFMQLKTAAYRHDDGAIVGVLAIGVDITDHKIAAAKNFLSLIGRNPFGTYVVDQAFRLAQISVGAQKVFSGIEPLIGRDFAEILRLVWPEPFASSVISKFKHTLETGDVYAAPDTSEKRNNIDAVESYDWQIERVTFPDGSLGVVCHFYDLSERNRYEAALQASEQRFRGVFENAGTGIAIAGLDGTIHVCNEAYAATLGYSIDELKGTKAQDLFYIDDRLDVAALLGDLAAGRSPFVELTGRSIAKSGKLVWLQKYLSTVLDVRGKPTQIIFLETDVTAVRRAHHRQQLLMRELAHRGKNLLAVIQSIANYTLTGEAGATELRRAFQGRIQALARTYGSLTNDAFEGAPLDGIISGELETYAERVAVDGPIVILTAKAAQTMSLVVHELATNAAKFGALSNAGGGVSISWRILDEKGGQWLQFDWQERGGPTIAPTHKRGFGTTIISVVAGSEFGTSPTVNYASDGFRYQLKLPLPAAGVARPEPAIRTKIKHSALRKLYDSWTEQRSGLNKSPMYSAFDRSQIHLNGSRLTIVEVDQTHTIRVSEPERALAELELTNGGDTVADNFTTMADAYVTCARESKPRYEESSFNFGEGDAVTFERLLVPYLDDSRRITHVVCLSAFDEHPSGPGVI